MSQMDWFSGAYDPHLDFLLSLHEAGVKIPKAKTKADTEPNGNPFIVVRDRPNEEATGPIANWAALKEANEIIHGRLDSRGQPMNPGDGWNEAKREYKFNGRVFKAGFRPDFYYGFHVVDGLDDKAKKAVLDKQKEIEWLTEQVREIMMMPYADKQARLAILTGKGGLLARLGDTGPGNGRALFRLFFHLRGKGFRSELASHYEAFQATPMGQKTGSEANLAALAGEVFGKGPTNLKLNDEDVDSFRKADYEARTWGHQLDKKLAKRRAMNGMLGLRIQADGKYEPFWNLAFHPWQSIKDSWRWYRHSYLGQRWNYHVYNPSIDKDGNFTWGGSNYQVGLFQGGRRDTPWWPDKKALGDSVTNTLLNAPAKIVTAPFKASAYLYDATIGATFQAASRLTKSAASALGLSNVFGSAAAKEKEEEEKPDNAPRSGLD
ncbi:MAG: hypothetical protein LRZ85_02700 [Alphaproteobacteria bacterium]|nr:hypothetical protein [Alphaproteobacteria bacterium]